jgi:hypothetical protein
MYKGKLLLCLFDVNFFNILPTVPFLCIIKKEERERYELTASMFKSDFMKFMTNVLYDK